MHRFAMLSIVTSQVVALGCTAPSALASDPWEAPTGFYDLVTGVGSALKSQLYDRMRTGHIERRYGDFRSSAAIHDRDPNNASNILLVYNRASVSAVWDSGSTWNREHVWPQSLQPGSASNSSRGNLGDPHALRPANPSINSSRSNKPFGFAATIGQFGSLGAFYFAGDSDKGDIARSLFYSDTRWGPVNGISLVDGAPGSDQMGDLDSLIAWHYLDTPDEFERRRNHTIYNQSDNPSFYTNNRNAYVDRPEFVWSVYVDQGNDSRLFVDTPDGNGASNTTVVLTPVLIDAPMPIEELTSLSRDGFDGVYYSVTASGEAVSPMAGRYNAFPINTSSSDTTALTVGIDAAAPSVPGLKTGQIVIDNLDVTTGAGAGRGANDGDDVITIELAMLDHAEASFNDTTNLDAAVIDLGVIERNAGDAMSSATIFNLEQTIGFTAGLDVIVGSGAGDTGAFSVGPGPQATIAPGQSDSLAVTLLDDVVGVFSATWTLQVFDDQTLTGAVEGDALTVTLLGEVVLSACAGDIDDDGVIDGADLGILLGAWGAGSGPTDLNGDGVTDGADLGLLLGAWGPCP